MFPQLRLLYEHLERGNKEMYRTNRERDRSKDRSREYKECYVEKGRRQAEPRDVEEQHIRKRKSRSGHPRSREREQRKWERDSHHRSFSYDKSYREYRERPRERSRERKERDRSRERRLRPAPYIEQIPVPIYYGNFAPGPVMVGPLVPIRGQVPLGGNRHPSMMGPLRLFPPRFISPDMYRLPPPLNPSMYIYKFDLDQGIHKTIFGKYTFYECMSYTNVYFLTEMLHYRNPICTCNFKGV
ncbi:PREDICTED: female-specific protein transformer-like [Habropoda laboriosa]|uniref:female-specific protein transformer-like n=1 Tax=Habropoda laboriosa TaxID=597456 RepID=UPI00083E438C|nr:PREDICTED: female-specific protein transformer-like [Habropoda laboriosa]